MDATGALPRRSDQTLRQFAIAALLMAGLIALFRLLLSLEPAGHPKQDGAIRSATICAGIAHFTIAFFFAWTRKAAPGSRGRRNLLLGLAAGGALCALCYTGTGVSRILFPSGFVALYFLIHEARDEYFFSKTHGDIPQEGLNRTAVLLLIGASVCGALAIAWNIPFIKAPEPGIRLLRSHVDFKALAGTPRLLWWFVPVFVWTALAVALFFRASTAAGLPVRRFLQAYRSLLLVYAGVVVLLLAGPKAEKAIYLVVLFHVAAWWVFTTRKLARDGRSEGWKELGWVDWFKRTQAGFQTLHVGLTALMILLTVLWRYGFDRAEENPLAWMVAPGAFSYWTIMHVTVSFVPSRG